MLQRLRSSTTSSTAIELSTAGAVQAGGSPDCEAPGQAPKSTGATSLLLHGAFKINTYMNVTPNESTCCLISNKSLHCSTWVWVDSVMVGTATAFQSCMSGKLRVHHRLRATINLVIDDASSMPETWIMWILCSLVARNESLAIC